MTFPRANQDSRLWSALIWALRISVVLGCVGTWDWLVRWEETPLLHWMIDPRDVGGLNWNESTALAIQQVVGWATLLAGLCVLVRPCAAVLAPVALLQLLIAVATWQISAGYSLESSWLSPQVESLFPLATHLARVAAPVGLLLLDPWRLQRPLTDQRVNLALRILQWSVAITFFAHGIEAWQHYPEFIDYWIITSNQLLGARMSQSAAERLLTLIGVLDFLSAILCVSTRWRTVWWWMAFWGATTALSRILAYGVDYGWHATLIRAPHAGIPLAVVLYWHLIKCRRCAGSDQDNTPKDNKD